jgi:hypothetical protein
MNLLTEAMPKSPDTHETRTLYRAFYFCWGYSAFGHCELCSKHNIWGTFRFDGIFGGMF